MAPPGGGRNDITGRFIRHLQVVPIDEFDESTMVRIFTAIADWHYSKGFDAVFTRLGKVSQSLTGITAKGSTQCLHTLARYVSH